MDLGIYLHTCRNIYFGPDLGLPYTISHFFYHEKSKYLLIKADELGEKIEISDKIKHCWIAIPIIK
ncbi:MAG: hypothetical protein RXS19_05120 [Caldisphaera sp.]|jgi:hypothetical protein